MIHLSDNKLKKILIDNPNAFLSGNFFTVFIGFRKFFWGSILFFGLLSVGIGLKAQQLPTDSLKGMDSYSKMDYSNALPYLL